MNYISHVIKSLEAQSAPLRNAIKNIMNILFAYWEHIHVFS